MADKRRTRSKLDESYTYITVRFLFTVVGKASPSQSDLYSITNIFNLINWYDINKI